MPIVRKLPYGSKDGRRCCPRISIRGVIGDPLVSVGGKTGECMEKLGERRQRVGDREELGEKTGGDREN